MDYQNSNLAEFLEHLSSAEATPGGGSSSALGASLAAALLMMVIRLTKEDHYEFNTFIQELERIREESFELIAEDARAFQEVMQAYRLPKGSEDEKELRKKRIQQALKEASITPFKTMKLSFRLLEIARRVVDLGNPQAISDVGVAALMALTAVKGGNYNVQINLQSIEDREWVSSLARDCENILPKAGELAREIETIILDSFGK